MCRPSCRRGRLVFCMVVTETYNDKEFGICDIVKSARARSVRIRAVDGRLRVVLPGRYSFSEAAIRSFIDEKRPILRRMLQESRSRYEKRAFHDGKVIPFYDGSIRFAASDAIGAGRVRLVDGGNNEYRLEYHRGDVIDSPAFTRAVSKYLLRFAASKAQEILPPLVAEISSALGVYPTKVCIGRGRCVLGHCSRRGVITLSAYVLFLPPHLRRYIICHELAHLSHFNHGKAFHQLCDAYCAGHEKEWRAELRKAEFPICV